MEKCMSCGKTALLTSTFGIVVLCKNCGSLINVSEWSTRDFTSAEELVYHKNNALQKAVANNMPQRIIDEISGFFDEYSNAGFITTINGKSGQTLKVFSDYCIVTTKSDGKKTELENMFYQFDDSDDDDDDSLISSDDKKNLVKGLMSGKLVQTGIGVALSATIKQQEKEKASEQKSRERHKNVERLITVGERRIDLLNMTGVEIFSRPNTANGYLKFVPKGTSANNLYNCEYFFFNNSIPFESKKIKQKVESMKTVICERIAVAEREQNLATERAEKERIEQQITLQAAQMRQMVEQAAQNSVQQHKADVFEEVRKFKQLLDEGIITDDEFNAKKKELLGL